MPKYRDLTQQEHEIIVNKGTESPFSGKYCDNKEDGIYICKRCGAKLFDSDSKFDSGCGWPSFDDEITGTVKKIPDADGKRTEILCGNCDGHLGHIFHGEGFTPKNTRYCVNSLSLDFDAKNDAKNEAKSKDQETAYFGAGCFWGVEYYFKKAKGVIDVKSGYMGGKVQNPTYEQVCSKQTDHIEVVKVTFDSKKTNFEEVCKLFFEIHDPWQQDGQGNDIGSQYLSAIFTTNPNQNETAKNLIKILEKETPKIATKIFKAQENSPQQFWQAEDYHQDYYQKNNSQPYCHFHTKRF